MFVTMETTNQCLHTWNYFKLQLNMSQEQATLPDSLEPPIIVQTGEIEKFQYV